MDIIQDDSEEDIFTDQISLKEVKRRLISVSRSSPLHINYRQSAGAVNTESEDETNSSIKIIETHSAPDILLSSNSNLHHPTMSKSKSTPGLYPDSVYDRDGETDDSFLRVELMIANMCKTPDKHKKISEIKKHFVHNQSAIARDTKQETNSPEGNPRVPFKSFAEDVPVILTTEERSNTPLKTPLKNNYTAHSKLTDTPYELYKTLSNEFESKVPIFKTSGKPLSKKKLLIKPKRYQNVIFAEDVPVILTTEERSNTPLKTPIKNSYTTHSKLTDTPYELYKTPSNEFESKVPIFKTSGKPLSKKKLLIKPKRYQNVIFAEDVPVILTTEERSNTPLKTPIKNSYTTHSKLTDTPYELYKTPSNEFESKVPIFKTPGKPLYGNKLLIKPKRYQHVISPVATYIRNGPQVPLLQDVWAGPSGVSYIPKPLKHLTHLNKENDKPKQLDNIKLPAVAYRSAKDTKMINIPNETRMPKNTWAKQVASSIPRAIVVNHSHRETSSAKKPLHPSAENSYADLTLHQADLSICTQKPTFSKPYK